MLFTNGYLCMGYTLSKILPAKSRVQRRRRPPRACPVRPYIGIWLWALSSFWGWSFSSGDHITIIGPLPTLITEGKHDAWSCGKAYIESNTLFGLLETCIPKYLPLLLTDSMCVLLRKIYPITKITCWFKEITKDYYISPHMSSFLLC